jgi:anti-sigma-K factor RskA
MNSEDFESMARLYVLGALESEDTAEFERLRHELGQRAERVIQECERLNSMFALSLRPTPPKASTKQKLLEMVNATLLGQSRNGHHS